MLFHVHGGPGNGGRYAASFRSAPPNTKNCRPRKSAGGAFYARITMSLNSCPLAKCSNTPPPLRTAVQSEYSPMQ